MKWLTPKSKEAIAKLIADFAKIIFAGYFAGEFFAKLSSLQKFLFWVIFSALIILFLILSVERGEEK